MPLTEWFEFDDTPGVEKLNFVFSSVAPSPKKPARPASASKTTPKTTPKTAPKSAPETEVVIVEPGGRELGEEAPEEASEEALANGRDLNRVQLKDGYYALGNVQQLRQQVGILLNLQHR